MIQSDERKGRRTAEGSGASKKKRRTFGGSRLQATVIVLAASTCGCFYGVDNEGNSGWGYNDPAQPLPRNAVTLGPLPLEERLAWEVAVTPVHSLSVGVNDILRTIVPALRYYVSGTAPLGTFVKVAVLIPYDDSLGLRGYPSVSVGWKGLSSRTTAQGLVLEGSFGALIIPDSPLGWFPIGKLSIGFAF